MKRTAVLLALLLAAPAVPGPEDKGLKSIDEKQIKAHMEWLASDAREGREAGSTGGHAAALYIADHYRRCGLQPGGQEGTFFQGFENDGVPGKIKIGEVKDANRLEVALNSAGTETLTLKMDDDLRVVAGSPETVAAGGIVFAGYGIVAPEEKWDDYKGAKVKEQIVMVLDREPRADADGELFKGKEPTAHSDWKAKAALAAKKGATALLIADEDDAFPDGMAWPVDGDPTFEIPVLYLSRSSAQKLADLAGKKLDKIQAEMDEKLRPEDFEIKGKAATARTSKRGEVQPGMKNIIAVWPGSDEKLKDEYIVVGGHYDHVGLGGPQTSRGTQGQIHNGSDDNASGTSALLELAEALQHAKFKRTIVIISFDGEEKGLWGSKAYVDAPPEGLPIDKCRWMLNMDMVSRNALTDIAVGRTDVTHDPLNRALTAAEKKFSLAFDYKGANAYVRRSDQWNFHEKGVPAIFMFGGMHADYHTEKDDVEKADFEKVQLVSRITFLILYHLANKEK